MTSSAQPNEVLLTAITSLAALAGDAAEAPLHKLVGEQGPGDRRIRKRRGYGGARHHSRLD